MVSIDVPTAVVAVLVSGFVTFWRDNVNEIIHSKLQRSSKSYREKREWLLGCRSLAEEIHGYALTAYGASQGVDNAVEPTIQGLREEFIDIEVEDIDRLDEIVEKLNSHEAVDEEIDGSLDAQLDVPFESLSDNEKEDLLEQVKEDLEEGIAENIIDNFSNAFDEKIGDEMYSYTKKMVRHYAERPMDVDESTYDAYQQIQIWCISYSISGIPSGDSLDRLERLREDLEEEIRGLV